MNELILGPRAIVLLSSLGFFLSGAITLRAALSTPVDLSSPEVAVAKGRRHPLGRFGRDSDGTPLSAYDYSLSGTEETTGLEEDPGDASYEVDLSGIQKQSAGTEVALAEDKPNDDGGAARGRDDPRAKLAATAAGTRAPTPRSTAAAPAAGSMEFDLPGGPVIGAGAAAASAGSDSGEAALTTTPHDLAIIQIKPIATVRLRANVKPRPRTVRVEIENRGSATETVPDRATLAELVDLRVESLGECPDRVADLHATPPDAAFPIALASKQHLSVLFDVTFDCANDPLRTTATDPGHDDFRYVASVDRSVLDGEPDVHPADDTCPRSVTPPYVIDRYPDGTIQDRGCGSAKSDGTFGGDVTTDVVVSP